MAGLVLVRVLAMNAHHDFVDGSTNQSSNMREKPGDPEPGVSSLGRGQVSTAGAKLGSSDIRNIQHSFTHW